MVDEYELVSHEELEFLRNELKKLRVGQAKDQLPHFADITPALSPLPAIPARVGPETRPSEPSSPEVNSEFIRSLNASLSRLNKVLERQYVLLERAGQEAARSPSPDEKFSRLERQNEKIAGGIVGLSNMIRDQQIQINQLSLLFKSIQSKVDEVRLQRRSAPSFKVPPPVPSKEVYLDRPKSPLVIPARQSSGPIEIDVPNPLGPEIMAEEKRESYPTFSMMNKPSPDTSKVLSQTPEDIPLPPQKKGVLSRFMNR
ncbi:MAG: hypothetical protein ABIJ21_02905 [Nanoarchaeota archaeon]